MNYFICSNVFFLALLLLPQNFSFASDNVVLNQTERSALEHSLERLHQGRARAQDSKSRISKAKTLAGVRFPFSKSSRNKVKSIVTEMDETIDKLLSLVSKADEIMERKEIGKKEAEEITAIGSVADNYGQKLEKLGAELEETFS